MEFQLHSPYMATGDQPQAIKQLVDSILNDNLAQTLIGVTGSGKTFTAANVISKINCPTLIISHNKTLAAQLYGELKAFFPNNIVEYFVSYYDYYQPEAYLPSSNVYIEKDLSINEELEKLRLRSVAALLTGRRDVIIVASVSCIYYLSNPDTLQSIILSIKTGDIINQKDFLLKLVGLMYSRSQKTFERGKFRVKGDSVDIHLSYADHAYRFIFFGNEIEAIQVIDPNTGRKISQEKSVSIFPSNMFITDSKAMKTAIKEIREDLIKQVAFFESNQRPEEAQRIQERTAMDLEMMHELGYCSGIENYSRYFDGRKAGQRPYCLIDYFPKDYLMVIDESHATIPQIRAMWGGDRARKNNLVDNAFRLPSALDNRPLNFQEFESLAKKVLYISATPSDYEIERSEGVVVEQIIRPTGLLDPKIDVRPTENQVDDIVNEIHNRVERQERVLITTLTKRMAEELSKYLEKVNVRCRYIHSEVKTLERVEILHELREGIFDVLVGVNLLREGLDLPEVSLVIILDADKEGFLRNVKSLIQTIGRAARNENGSVIMYADRITESMRTAIQETDRRRKIQGEYNKLNNIIPRSTTKSTLSEIKATPTSYEDKSIDAYQNIGRATSSMAADPMSTYMNREQLIKSLRHNMEEAAKTLNFTLAVQLRDKLLKLESEEFNKTV